MAQVFDRGLVLALKTTGLIAIVLIAAGIFAWRWSIAYPFAIAAPPQQPLPFSHLHHVRDDGIDCRYCHTSVEKSAFAGVPSSEICMTCHSQLFRDVSLFKPLHDSFANEVRLKWTRVNDLPDFVFFDHSAHITHGVPCKECHGQLDQMPLTARVQTLNMQWCISCHRDPAAHLVAPEKVFSMQAQPPRSHSEQQALMAHYRVLDARHLTDCSTCHR